MSDNKPVVVYGASGVTGALVCEFLREYQIPFIAAGRNEEKIKASMATVPGIETADYEVRTVEHTVEGLTELLTGAKVICNVVGPMERFGETVVQAALAAGCHYIDTTGESPYMKDMKAKYGEGFKEKGLALAPSTAYMYAPLEICAHIALEAEEVDTLEAISCSNGIPTYASTQTLFSSVGQPATFLQDNQMVPWPPHQGYEVNIPGFVGTQLALHWGGGSLPIWFEDNFQVRNCRSLTTFPDRPAIQSMLDLEGYYREHIEPLPKEEQEQTLTALADEMQPGNPPRENRLVHRCVDHVVGTGNGIQRNVTMHSAPAYIQTGMIQAGVCYKLINEGPDKAGFVSPCEAVGYKYLLGQMKRFFPIDVTVS